MGGLSISKLLGVGGELNSADSEFCYLDAPLSSLYVNYTVFAKGSES
jgi:hypothetical protein